MNVTSIALSCLALGCLSVSGVFDGRAFVNTSKFWSPGNANWGYLLNSLGFNLLGIAFYHASVAFISIAGIRAPELQVLIWFIVAMTTMAILSGAISGWPLDVRIVFLVAVVSVVWIVYRTSG